MPPVGGYGPVQYKVGFLFWGFLVLVGVCLFWVLCGGGFLVGFATPGEGGPLASGYEGGLGGLGYILGNTGRRGILCEAGRGLSSTGFLEGGVLDGRMEQHGWIVGAGYAALALLGGVGWAREERDWVTGWLLMVLPEGAEERHGAGSWDEDDMMVGWSPGAARMAAGNTAIFMFCQRHSAAAACLCDILPSLVDSGDPRKPSRFRGPGPRLFFSSL